MSESKISMQVQRCLENDGEFQYLNSSGINACAYGITLPCKYQGRPYESRIQGQKTGEMVFPCMYVPLERDVQQVSRESDEPYTDLDELVDG